MFRTLLLTEIRANKKLLLISFLINLFFALLLGVWDARPHSAFVAATLIVFYVHLAVLAADYSDQRRMRLYAQLPVSPDQVSLACWSLVLIWLAAQVLLWLLYGLLLAPEFGSAELIVMGKFALSALAIIATVSLALDLGRFRPRYLQWLFIGALATALAAAIYFDLSFSFLGPDEGEITLSWPWGVAVAMTVFVVFFLADLGVYRRSDHYLK